MLPVKLTAVLLLTLALTHPLDVAGRQVTCSAQDVRASLQKKGMMGNLITLFTGVLGNMWPEFKCKTLK